MLASAANIVGVVVAVLIGLAAGWLLARRGRDRAVAAAREAATAGTFKLADELYARTKRATELESRLAAVRAQVSALKDAVGAADERVHALEGEAESHARAASALEIERAALASRVAELAAESTPARGEIEGWRTKLAAAERDVATRTAQVEEIVAGLRSKEDEIAGSLTRLAAAESAAVEHRRDVDRLAALLRASDDEIATLRAQLQAFKATRQAATRDRQSEVRGAPALPPLSSRARRAARLPEDPRPARRERSGDGNERDDLKLIYGVGPVLERLLHRSRIYTYRQIANWTREDVDAMASTLPELNARIRRDNWIAGARKEHRKKYGTDP